MKFRDFIILFLNLIANMFAVYLIEGQFGWGEVFLSILLTSFTFFFIRAIIDINWPSNDEYSSAYLMESTQEEMLYIMQYGHNNGIKGAFEEFNKIFNKYPFLHLQDWEVFRAWYKYQIDFMLERPEIYEMKNKLDGLAYSKEKDPLYDPNALDWEQFGIKRYEALDIDDDDDDDDEECKDDITNDTEHNMKKAAKDGFMMGVGFGITNQILNN